MRIGLKLALIVEQAVDKLRLRVLDAHALGDPGFLGEAALDLRPLQLEPNAPPVNVWLPLQARLHVVRATASAWLAAAVDADGKPMLLHPYKSTVVMQHRVCSCILRSDQHHVEFATNDT